MSGNLRHEPERQTVNLFPDPDPDPIQDHVLLSLHLMHNLILLARPAIRQSLHPSTHDTHPDQPQPRPDVSFNIPDRFQHASTSPGEPIFCEQHVGRPPLCIDVVAAESGHDAIRHPHQPDHTLYRPMLPCSARPVDPFIRYISPCHLAASPS